MAVDEGPLDFPAIKSVMLYLKHFVEHTKPSVALLVDSHDCHHIIIKKEQHWLDFHFVLRTAFNCLMCLFYGAITPRPVTISWR